MISSVLLLSNCTKPEPEVITQTEIVKLEIPIQPRPREVDLADPNWRVINHENVDEFLNEVKVADQFVFIAISVRDYEKLSLNVSELKRYIEQQRELILYYEKSIRDQSL